MYEHTKFHVVSTTPAGALADDNRNQASTGLWGRLLTGFLDRTIRKGTLTLVLPNGARCKFGTGDPKVTVEITEPASLRRIALNPDLAVGEAFMDGTLRMQRGNIYDFLALCLSNLETAPKSRLRNAWKTLHRMVRPLTLFNPVSAARRNVAHHYDLSDELYDLFLDADRQYSCAYFRSPDDTLEDAQEQKKRHIAAKLSLKPGQNVLDIGSGWGGLALSLATEAGVSVAGLTLSVEQLAHANARASAAGLDDRVQFHLRDYRQENGHYDRVVSVGMFEHVGPSHYEGYFGMIADRLNKDGVALVHTIGTSRKPGAPNPWIRKHIFPGGYVPSMSEILPAIENSGLIVTDVEVLRLHYAKTLRIWRQRFLAERYRAATIYDERFCRMWEFYLAACEAGFRYNGLVVFQIQLAKKVGTLPVDRDYMTEEEQPVSENRWRNSRIGTATG